MLNSTLLDVNDQFVEVINQDKVSGVSPRSVDAVALTAKQPASPSNHTVVACARKALKASAIVDAVVTGVCAHTVIIARFGGFRNA